MQLWVYGSSFENFLVAVVVPKEANLQRALQQEGIAAAPTMPLKVRGARQQLPAPRPTSATHL